MSRYSARRYSKAKDLWGIWDKFPLNVQTGSPLLPGYVMNEDGTRWTSSQVGARYCAEKWNDALS